MMDSKKKMRLQANHSIRSAIKGCLLLHKIYLLLFANIIILACVTGNITAQSFDNQNATPESPFFDHPAIACSGDFLIPGLSTWRAGKWWEAGIISAIRISTPVIAWRSYQELNERKSEIKAAKNGAPFRSSGALFYSFYDKRYISIKEMESKADRARFKYAGSLTVYTIVTLFSLYRTFEIQKETLHQNAPQFDVTSYPLEYIEFEQNRMETFALREDDLITLHWTTNF